MIDRHYVRTLARYVEDLASMTALLVHCGATPERMREVVKLSKTVTTLANASLEDAQP